MGKLTNLQIIRNEIKAALAAYDFPSGGDILLADTYDKDATDGILLCSKYDVGE